MKDYEKYMQNLPVIPDVAIKIIGIAEEDLEMSFRELEETIKIDPALTSKILKVANSAIYARQKEITNLQTAISLLGFKNIKSLILLISAASVFKKQESNSFYRDFWQNAIMTAFYARDLAFFSANKDLAEDVFLAGLLHKIGQVALYRGETVRYKSLLDNLGDKELIKAEKEYFETDHKSLGSLVLQKWNFPDIFADTAKEYGSENIVSQHKKEVQLVSLAHDLAEIHLGSMDTSFLENNPRARRLGFNNRKMDEFLDKFNKTVTEDGLYLECCKLFGMSRG